MLYLIIKELKIAYDNHMFYFHISHLFEYYMLFQKFKKIKDLKQ